MLIAPHLVGIVTNELRTRRPPAPPAYTIGLTPYLLKCVLAFDHGGCLAPVGSVLSVKVRNLEVRKCFLFRRKVAKPGQKNETTEA